MKQSVISVLMPVYNAEKFLAEAIESILGQTFIDFEFIIINDGSTDRSEEIILSYQDARIRYFKNDVNLKLIKTLNRGLGLASGKYIARMDADDISELNRLQVQFDFMETNPKIGIVGSGFINFKDGSKEISRTMYKPDHDEICFKHLYQMHLCHGTCMIRSQVLTLNSLNFSLEYEHAEDFELFTRISSFTRLANIQSYLYKVRHHDNEVSKIFASTQIQNSYKVIKRSFDKIGYAISDVEIEAYILLNQFEYSKIRLEANQLQIFLEKLIIENSKSKIIEIAYFTNNIQFLWFNYCYNLHGLKDYRNSKILTNGFTFPLLKRLKWMIK